MILYNIRSAYSPRTHVLRASSIKTSDVKLCLKKGKVKVDSQLRVFSKFSTYICVHLLCTSTYIYVQIGTFMYMCTKMHLMIISMCIEKTLHWKSAFYNRAQ